MFTVLYTHLQAAMDSMTEVLARAVYGLNLNELPLEHLTLGFQRPRTVSVGRHQTSSSQHEIAQPRLSSFSAIFDGPPASRKAQQSTTPSTRSHSKEQVDSSTRTVRGKLVHAATEERESYSMVDLYSVKRHSTPAEVAPSSKSLVLPDTILEVSPDHSLEEHPSPVAISPPSSSSVSGSLVTPYQPLIEDDERGELSKGEEERGGGGASEVITNLNTTSPTPSQDVMMQSSTPIAMPPRGGGGQEKERSGGGHKKSAFSSNIRKHRSPDVKHKKGLVPKNLVLTNQSSMEEDGKSKRMRKWFHKRWGSDSTTHIIVARKDEPSVKGESAEVVDVAFDASSPATDDSESCKPFSLHKSSSDGSINRLLMHGHSLPKMGPRLSPLVTCLDTTISESGFRRVTTVGADPTHNSPPADADENISPLATTSPRWSPHAVLQRSITIDSPEPTLSGMQDIILSCKTHEGGRGSS